jgi:hypothetical protein
MNRVFKTAMLTAVLSLLVMSASAVAAVYDISVAPDGDRMYYWEKGWGWTDTGWITDSNPNQVSHYYDYDNRSGAYRDTYLSFDLGSIKGKVTDIMSASLNINILSIWTDGRNDVGSLSGIGSVYADGGTGWKSFDVTESLRNVLSAASGTADYSFLHTGFSGFQFSSAESGQPAFLRITTEDPLRVASAVPIPPGVWLLGSGLLGLVGIHRKLRG